MELKILSNFLCLCFFLVVVSANVRHRRPSEFFRNHLPGVATTPECVDTIYCSSEQVVAKCVTCRPEFFYCTGPGAEPIVQYCLGGKVFNTDPALPMCVLPGNCPLHPPWTVPSTSTPSPTPTTATSTSTTTTLKSTTTPAATTTSATATTTTSPTTTATMPTTTTSTPTTTGDCLSAITCPDKGYHAKCNYCYKDYFMCYGAGQPGVIQSCVPGKLFDTNPGNTKCVDENLCPTGP